MQQAYEYNASCGAASVRLRMLPRALAGELVLAACLLWCLLPVCLRSGIWRRRAVLFCFFLLLGEHCRVEAILSGQQRGGACVARSLRSHCPTRPRAYCSSCARKNAAAAISPPRWRLGLKRRVVRLLSNTQSSGLYYIVNTSVPFLLIHSLPYYGCNLAACFGLPSER